MTASNITLSPVNTFSTPKYERSVPIDLNGNYVPPNSGGTNTTVRGWLYGARKSSAPAALANQAISSNNQSTGITYMAFWNASRLSGITFDVGPNNSGPMDFGDSIYFDSSKSNGIIVENSTFVVGVDTSAPNVQDRDLIVFGSKNSKDNWNGVIGAGIDLDDEASFINSSMRSGDGDDTIIFASRHSASVIQGSTVNVGNGSDYIFINNRSSNKLLRGTNTINLGSGPNDGSDTIVFASNAIDGTLEIRNFQPSTDFIRIANVSSNGALSGFTYTSSPNSSTASISGQFGGITKLTFVN